MLSANPLLKTNVFDTTLVSIIFTLTKLESVEICMLYVVATSTPRHLNVGFNFSLIVLFKGLSKTVISKEFAKSSLLKSLSIFSVLMAVIL